MAWLGRKDLEKVARVMCFAKLNNMKTRALSAKHSAVVASVPKKETKAHIS